MWITVSILVPYSKYSHLASISHSTESWQDRKRRMMEEERQRQMKDMMMMAAASAASASNDDLVAQCIFWLTFLSGSFFPPNDRAQNHTHENPLLVLFLLAQKCL
jgi:hypothetical protein